MSSRSQHSNMMPPSCITGQDERQVPYFDNLTPRDRYRKTNLLNCTHSESIYPNPLTFTHDSVRLTLSSDGTDEAGLSCAEVLLKRFRPTVQCDTEIRGARRTGWFTLRLFAKADALQNTVVSRRHQTAGNYMPLPKRLLAASLAC